MIVCAVPSCVSNSKETSNYSFHRLPKSLIRRARWVVALGPMSNSSYVCSRHFEPNMLKKCGNTIKLMPGAVPKLFLDPVSYRSTSPTEASPHLTECSEETDEESRDELVACRACLAAEGRLYAISSNSFEDPLATLTGTSMPEAVCLPQYLCAFCRAILTKFIAFRDRCQRSTALLESLLEKGPLKMNDIIAIDRDTHQLSYNLTSIKAFQLDNDPLVEVMPLVKTENNENSDEDTDCIEAEYLDFDVGENNDSCEEYKDTFESLKEKQETCKTEKEQLKPWERMDIKKDKTEYDVSQLQNDDDVEINGEYDDDDTYDVETDTSEETLNVRKRMASLINNSTKTAKKKKTYELPPPIDIEAFENNTFESPKEIQDNNKTEKIQLKQWERMDIEKDKTECVSQLDNDDVEINDEYDTDTSEETLNVKKIMASLIKHSTKTAKKKKTYELPPPIDIKAFEKKYNVDYKFMDKVEQKQEIEERKANNALRYCCDMCGQGYRQEHSMVNHLWIHDPRLGPFECDVCLKRFRSSHRLLRHRYTHRDRFTCRECGLVSRDSSRAKFHYKVHQGSTHPCPYCDEVYVRLHSVYNHIRARHPEQNVPCDECGETFRSEIGVRQHKALVHRPITKEILRCKDCDVTFSSAEALQRHEKLGAGVPHAALWPCAACGDSCGSETALAAHAAERHPPDQLHCDKCNKTFANASSFSLHEARKHRGERATSGPFRRAPTKVTRRTPGTGPRRRTRRKPGPERRRTAVGPRPPGQFVCEICGRKLVSFQNLEYHRNAHFGIKPFPCPICDKSFTAKITQQKHMLVHTGERPYQCDHCMQSFSQKPNLQKHINNVHLRIKATCQYCGKSMGEASLADHVRHVHLNVAQKRRKRDRRNECKRKRAQSDIS